MTSEQLHYDKMTKSPLVKLIVSLGIPTTISMLVTNIYNMVDTYFVGTLGESPQAATGILFALQAVIQAIAFMLGQGSGTMVSKALADRNKKEADTYVSTAFFVGIATGIVMTVFGFLFLTPLLNLLGSTPTILPYAKQYGGCVLITCPVMIGSFVLNNNLRYEGKSFYAMIGLVSGGILNIFFDYLLVSVIPLGILGAGVATAVSQMISFVLLLVFHTLKAQSTISLKAISKKFSVIFTVCRVGFPGLIRQGLSSFSTGLLNNLTRPYGDAAIAAMSVVNRFSGFIMCVGLGVGQGFQPVASFNYQAKEYGRVKKGLLATMGIGFAFLSIIVAPCFIYSQQIVAMFQENSEVIAIGSVALQYACLGTLFLALSVPINMLYQSIRKPLISSVLSLLRSGVMFIPVLLITTKLWGLVGVQISQPIADLLTGVASIPFIIVFLSKKKTSVGACTMDFESLAKARQSCRNYNAEKPIEEEKITRILQVAALAPSACNGQPYHFTVCRGEVAKKVAKATTGVGINAFAKDAPVLLVISEEPYTKFAAMGAKLKGNDYRSIDIGIVSAYITSQATELGLGSCILGWFDDKKIREICNLSGTIRLVITLGYAKDNDSLRKKKRKSLEELVTNL